MLRCSAMASRSASKVAFTNLRATEVCMEVRLARIAKCSLDSASDSRAARNLSTLSECFTF